MKAVLAQIAPTLGNLERNLKLHLAEIARAQRAGADLVIFPELSLTGYLLQDLVADCAQEAGVSPLLAALVKASRRIGVIAGFVERGRDQILYNAAACFVSGRPTKITSARFTASAVSKTSKPFSFATALDLDPG